MIDLVPLCHRAVEILDAALVHRVKDPVEAAMLARTCSSGDVGSWTIGKPMSAAGVRRRRRAALAAA